MKIHVPGAGCLLSAQNFWASAVVSLDLFVSAARLCVCALPDDRKPLSIMIE